MFAPITFLLFVKFCKFNIQNSKVFKKYAVIDIKKGYFFIDFIKKNIKKELVLLNEDR